MRSVAVDCKNPVATSIASLTLCDWHSPSYRLFPKGNEPMTKSIESMTEIVRNPKHPFRKADDLPAKPQKHRYERRKIRSFLRVGTWIEERAT